MGLFALLVAGLVAAADDATRRARVHEVVNRLGLRPEEGGGDLRSRMAWAFAHLEERGLQKLLVQWIGDVDPVYERWFTTQRELMPTHWADWPSQAWLPPAGVRSRRDVLVPWFTRILLAAWRHFSAEHAGLEAWAGGRLLEGKEAQRASVATFAMEEGEPIRHRLHDVVDWIEAERPDLSRLDWDDAVDATVEWHASLKKYTQGGVALPGVVVARWPDGATLQRLLTAAQLEAEGVIMGHCVGRGGYWQKVRDQESVILSYRDPEGKPQATIEVETYPAEPLVQGDIHVLQVQGPDNGPMVDRIGARRLRWALEDLAQRKGRRLEVWERSGFAEVLEVTEGEWDALFTEEPPQAIFDAVEGTAILRNLARKGVAPDRKSERQEKAYTLHQVPVLLKYGAEELERLRDLVARQGIRIVPGGLEQDASVAEAEIVDSTGGPIGYVHLETGSGADVAWWWIEIIGESLEYLGSHDYSPARLLREAGVLRVVKTFSWQTDPIGAWAIDPREVLDGTEAFVSVHGRGATPVRKAR